MAPILAGDRQVTHLDLHGSPGLPGLQVWGLGERREGVAVGLEEGEDHFEHEVSRPGLRCRRLNVRTVLALMLSPAFGGGLCTPWVCFEHSCVFSVGVSRRTRSRWHLPLSVSRAAQGGGCWGPWLGLRGRGAEHLCGRRLCGRLQSVLTAPPPPPLLLPRPSGALCWQPCARGEGNTAEGSRT